MHPLLGQDLLLAHHELAGGERERCVGGSPERQRKWLLQPKEGPSGGAQAEDDMTLVVARAR